LPAFSVPFVKALSQRGADCGFYAAYNAILFARQKPLDMFTNKSQYTKMESKARARIAMENYAKIPELEARLARANVRRDQDDIRREIQRRKEVAKSSYITSDDVGIILSDMEPSIAICGENPRGLIETFNQNRTNPHFLATYAEGYGADQLTRNLMLRIADFQQGGAGARLVIVASSATIGAHGHWIAVELVKNDTGGIVARAADSAGQHADLAKSTVVLALDPMIRDIAETIRRIRRTEDSEEPAALRPEPVQQTWDFPLFDLGDRQPSPSSSSPSSSSSILLPPTPLKSFPAPSPKQPIQMTQPKTAPRTKPVPQPSTPLPSSSSDASRGPDLQRWWDEHAKSRAAFVLPFYRESSGQKVFILGREAQGSDRGTYSLFGGKWEQKDRTPAAGAAREFHEESGVLLKSAQAYVSRAEVFAVNTTNDASRPRHLVAFYIVELSASEVGDLRQKFASRRDHEMDQLGEVSEGHLLNALDGMGPKDSPSVQSKTGSIRLRNIFFRVKNYLRNPRAGIGGSGRVRFQDSRLKG
jgi:8-oxo-dGTP pyrophosphatase MutT (NUDIX family)